MKKLLFITMLMCVQSLCKSQVQIVKKFDAIDKKYTYMALEPVILEDSKGKIKMWPRLYGKEGKLKLEGIIVDISEVFKCNKKDQLILLLDGDLKIKKYSFDILSCNGSLFFELDKGDLRDLLDFKKILEIRITNNYTGEVFQTKIPIAYQTYFADVIALLDKPCNEIKD